MPDCIRVPDILLPREGIDRTKWAVVACDQFTSQPEYWARVKAFWLDSLRVLQRMRPFSWQNVLKTQARTLWFCCLTRVIAICPPRFSRINPDPFRH